MEQRFRYAKESGTVTSEEPMQATGVDRLNAAEVDEARELLLACAAVPRWADEIVRGRPYASVEDVLEAAREAALPWSDDEVDAALARHPRIGERPPGGEADAEHSRREQAGVAGAGPDVARRLAEGNRAYEERFGHVFLIRAAGRGPEEILAALDERLANDPATERRTAAEQLREIAVLRLQGELT
jgi:2-oxo-4-hydroxy-4-carboxy-5-ureidoimidazoline decarboxylase